MIAQPRWSKLPPVIMAKLFSKTDRRLLGTWRSDRRRTLKEWRFRRPLSPVRRKAFLKIFGKLQLTYTRKRMRGVLGDHRFARSYEVLACDSDSVAIRYYDDVLMQEWRIAHIHFEKDHYWVSVGPNREWFKRVKKSE